MSTLPADPDIQGEFVFLACSICEEDRFVSVDTRKFQEVGRGTMLAYYGEDEQGRPVLTGISDGRAENFECLNCHSRNWLREVRRRG